MLAQIRHHLGSGRHLAARADDPSGPTFQRWNVLLAPPSSFAFSSHLALIPPPHTFRFDTITNLGKRCFCTWLDYGLLTAVPVDIYRISFVHHRSLDLAESALPISLLSLSPECLT